jgi:hypothetical protein
MLEEVNKKDVVFLCGFGWSGSSAVADWLYDSGKFSQPGIEQEILPISFGLCRALNAAEANYHLDTVLSAFALLPDNHLFKTQLKKNLPKSSLPLLLTLSLSWIQFLIFRSARRKLTNRMDLALSALLSGDFRKSEGYISDVSGFFDILDQIRQSGDSPETKSSISESLTKYFTSILLRLTNAHGGADNIVTLDNAISGYFLRYFKYVDFSNFRRAHIITISRDPRDQFIDRVACSLKTTRFSHKEFVRDYKAHQVAIESLEDHCRRAPNVSIINVRFEDFVINANSVRDCVWKALSESLGIEHDHSSHSNKFNPEKSVKNIGIWKQSKLKRQLLYISHELQPFLHE